MNTKSRLMLKALVYHYHKGQEKAFLKYLPEAQVEALAKLEISDTSLPDLLQLGRISLQYVHYSWLETALLAMPPVLQGPCLASLPTRIRTKLGTLTGRKIPSAAPCRRIQDYLLDSLQLQVANSKVRPRALLLQTDFDYLLGMSKHQLVDLIGYLGIHDLAITMRHIVDKSAVQQIMGTLRPEKRDYLKLCLRSKNPLKTPDINLKDWDGSSQQLDAKLQRRGMARFGKALAGQDPSFLWHLVRTLDTGRGKALTRQFSPKALPGVTPFLAGQVGNIARYMEK